jgi:hypothetical protein
MRHDRGRRDRPGLDGGRRGEGHGLEDDASVVKVYAALAGLDLPAK